MANSNGREAPQTSTNSNNPRVFFGGTFPSVRTSDVILEDVSSYEDEVWQNGRENDVDDYESKILTVKETLESYLNSLFAFQRWFETVYEEVLTTFDDVRWLEEQILLHPTLDENESIGKFTPLLLAKTYARQAQQIEQIIGDQRQQGFLNDETRSFGQRVSSPCVIFNILKDAIFAAAVAVFKMVDSSPHRQKARYQRVIPKQTLMVYKSLLRHLCSGDTPAPSGPIPDDFLFDGEDPFGPIKTSLERTIELLQVEESLVEMFLVKGHKKLVIQTRTHPRPSVLLKQHSEMLYEAVWEQFHQEYHFIRRMLGEIEYLLETRQPMMEELRLDIMDQFDDWPGPFIRRCKEAMRVKSGQLCAQLVSRCICRNYFHIALGSA